MRSLRGSRLWERVVKCMDILNMVFFENSMNKYFSSIYMVISKHKQFQVMVHDW